jgi:hypothetical protein
MRPPRHKALVDKAISACLAAVEIYNKPLFPHREEVFAIMMINAWELLLKARLLKEGGNKMRVLYQMETPDTKAGKPGRRQKVRMTGGGTPRTITLGTAIAQAAKLKTNPLPPVAEDNIRAIAEIRNAAVHFVNADEKLRERVWQLGTGSLRNFMRAGQDWFGVDLSEHRLFMMPLAFVQPEEVEAVPLKERAKEIASLTAFLDALEKRHAGIGADQPFVMGLKLEFKLAASRQVDAPAVRLTTDPKALAIRLSEEELKARFPLTYETLVERLQERYSDFKVNKAFHNRRKRLEGDPKLTHERKLDPFNKNSAKKRFYAPGMVDRFDAFYTKKSTTKPAAAGAPAPPAAATKQPEVNEAA